MARHILLLWLTHTQFKFQECLRGQRHPVQNSFSFHLGLYQQAAASKVFFLPDRLALCARFSLKAFHGWGIPSKSALGQWRCPVVPDGQRRQWLCWPGVGAAPLPLRAAGRSTGRAPAEKTCPCCSHAASQGPAQGHPVPERAARSSWRPRGSGRTARPRHRPGAAETTAARRGWNRPCTALRCVWSSLLLRSVHWMAQIKKTPLN